MHGGNVPKCHLALVLALVLPPFTQNFGITSLETMAYHAQIVLIGDGPVATIFVKILIIVEMKKTVVLKIANLAGLGVGLGRGVYHPKTYVKAVVILQ
jgi:hypothetical protein